MSDMSDIVEKLNLENCTDELGNSFIKYLDDNAIEYRFVRVPCFEHNGLNYECKSANVSCFSEFGAELKLNSVDEIFLFKLIVNYDDDGRITYRIRYAESRDVLTNNLRALSSAFAELEESLRLNHTFSSSKVRKFLNKKTAFAESEIDKIVECVKRFCPVQIKHARKGE